MSLPDWSLPDWEMPEWAEARGRALNHFPAIDPARAALVVIDMQGAFITAGAPFANPRAEAIIPAVNRLAGRFRAARAPVIWTRQSVGPQPPLAMPAWQYDPADPFVAGAMAALTPGAALHGLHPAMAVAPGDAVIDKYR
ncbi:MAG TPA: isochorismatase family protein, partial [Novosphingobium sp.]|nr:isochorismatase family protein [Novosphingobium sp.]